MWGFNGTDYEFFNSDLTNYPYQNPPIFFSIGEAMAFYCDIAMPSINLGEKSGLLLYALEVTFSP